MDNELPGSVSLIFVWVGVLNVSHNCRRWAIRRWRRRGSASSTAGRTVWSVGRWTAPGWRGASVRATMTGQPSATGWRCNRPPGGGVIHHVLPRTSLLARRRPLAHQAQAVAANIDVVFVVTSAERSPNLRRIERYLTVVWSSGARPVLVLNKSDLSPRPGQRPPGAGGGHGRRRRLHRDQRRQRGGARLLRAQLPVGLTGAMVGPSGVGKVQPAQPAAGGGSPGHRRGAAGRRQGPPHHHPAPAVRAARRGLPDRHARACGSWACGTPPRASSRPSRTWRRWPPAAGSATAGTRASPAAR